MDNNSQISDFRNKIYNILKKEVGDKECALLDLPNYYNPGDQLIWEGEVQAIKALNINLEYSSSLLFFNPKLIKESYCLLLQGGGNFGDIYSKHQNFRESVIKNFPKNKIIILPLTAHFSNKSRLQKSAEIFSTHYDITLIARDENSFKILKDNFKNCKIYLAPDTAFAITNLKPPAKNNSGKVLFLCRTDNELQQKINSDSLNFINNLEVSDWPNFNNRSFELLVHGLSLLANKSILTLLNLSGSHWNKENDIYGLIKYHSKEKQINQAVNLLSKYDLVITTRLHGHILACLLGIPNILLNNSYGKNKNFYETWMKNNSLNSFYAESIEDVKKIVTENFKDKTLA